MKRSELEDLMQKGRDILSEKLAAARNQGDVERVIKLESELEEHDDALNFLKNAKLKKDKT